MHGDEFEPEFGDNTQNHYADRNAMTDFHADSIKPEYEEVDDKEKLILFLRDLRNWALADGMSPQEFHQLMLSFPKEVRQMKELVLADDTERAMELGVNLFNRREQF